MKKILNRGAAALIGVITLLSVPSGVSLLKTLQQLKLLQVIYLPFQEQLEVENMLREDEAERFIMLQI